MANKKERFNKTEQSVNEILKASKQGYFSIGLLNNKCPANLGTLFRHAYCFGASEIFTIGCRYELQSSDTLKSYKTIPLRKYATFDEFYEHIPYSAKLVGIELSETS